MAIPRRFDSCSGMSRERASFRNPASMGSRDSTLLSGHSYCRRCCLGSMIENACSGLQPTAGSRCKRSGRGSTCLEETVVIGAC